MNVVEPTGWTPLARATAMGDGGLVLQMLKLGADPNLAIDDSMYDASINPIWEAAERGNRRILSDLLLHGADPDPTTTDTGESPLTTAASLGHSEVAGLLILFGAARHTVTFGHVGFHTASVLAERAGHSHLGFWLKAQLDPTTSETTSSIRGLEVPRNCGVYPDLMRLHGSWSRTVIGVGCRLNRELRYLLRRGRIDPDGGGAKGCLQIRHVANTASPWGAMAKSGAAAGAAAAAGDAVGAGEASAGAYAGGAAAASGLIPINEPKEIDAATVKLALQATSGWAPKTHWLHHSAARAAVHTCLAVSERLHRAGVGQGVVGSVVNKPRNGGGAALPLLPPEMWITILGFVQRSFWAVV